MRNKSVLILPLCSLLFFGCEDNPLIHKEEKKYDVEEASPEFKKDSAPDVLTGAPEEVTKAFSVVKPKSDSKVVGAVSFTKVDGGVRIVADIGGLKPGKHGFHIHEKGDCSAHDASSAGGHFNPTHKKHGGPDDKERHVGDLGNLEANEHGFAHYDRVDSVIQLNGEDSIVGKSVVIHADPDDLKTQPTGNSGARVACGVIHAAVQ